MKEDVAQILAKNESLKERSEAQAQELAKKIQLEKELDDARSEQHSLRLTHDEYRKLLKSKVSMISDCNQKLETLKAQTSTRIRELEYTITQANKRLDALVAENKQLSEKICEAQVNEVKMDRILLSKEEELEDAQ